MTCTDCKFAVFAICIFTIDVETGFQRKGERVKIEQINDEILVIDDFLTRDEEEHINHNFKVLSGDIIGQTMSSFHLSDLAGTYLLPVKVVLIASLVQTSLRLASCGVFLPVFGRGS